MFNLDFSVHAFSGEPL